MSKKCLHRDCIVPGETISSLGHGFRFCPRHAIQTMKVLYPDGRAVRERPTRKVPA